MEPQRLRALKRQVIIRFGLAAILIPAFLFAMAGTIHYWKGWLYFAVLLIPMVVAVVYFLRTDPELLERRMKYKEKEHEQRTIIRLGASVLVGGFLAIAIDLRLHGLNQISTAIMLAANAGVFLGYCLILWVFKENSYASRTIEVVKDQKSHHYRPIFHHPPPYVPWFSDHVPAHTNSSWILVCSSHLFIKHSGLHMADTE